MAPCTRHIDVPSVMNVEQVNVTMLLLCDIAVMRMHGDEGLLCITLFLSVVKEDGIGNAALGGKASSDGVPVARLVPASICWHDRPLSAKSGGQTHWHDQSSVEDDSIISGSLMGNDITNAKSSMGDDINNPKINDLISPRSKVSERTLLNRRLRAHYGWKVGAPYDVKCRS